MSDYAINEDPRFSDKVATVSTGKEIQVGSCYECPYYQKNELKNWEFCHEAGKELDLKVGQSFPMWCPLEIAE